jgi:arylsulfatase A-like enzyme
VPAIFGLNFQSVSTAQKLPTSNGLTGGYETDGLTPGPLLSKALDFANAEIGALMAEIQKQHLGNDTTIILSAKHGQSPTVPSALTRVDDGPILDALNAAWAKLHPAAKPLVAFSTDDDGMLLWLNDRSKAATKFAKDFLKDYSGTGTDINKAAKKFTSSGLRKIYVGEAAADFIGVPQSDARVPDVIGVAQYGTVFTGGTKKIAEHGGDSEADRNVPVVVSGAGVEARGVNSHKVETTEIAPTILTLLGLDPKSLQAVRQERTSALPGL